VNQVAKNTFFVSGHTGSGILPAVRSRRTRCLWDSFRRTRSRRCWSGSSPRRRCSAGTRSWNRYSLDQFFTKRFKLFS